MNHLRRTLFLASFCSLSVLSSGCKKEKPPQRDVVRPVKMLTVGDQGGSGKLEFPGTIRAADEATLSFEVDGKLQKVFVSEGDRVEENTPLAQLDDRDYAAHYEEVLAQQKEARARYDRAKELFANDSISKQDLDVDRRTFEVAVARLKTAQKGVEDTILRAPFDGIVAKRFAENFEQVRAKQDIFFFHAETGLEVKVDIPERIVRAYGEKTRGKNVEARATKRFTPKVYVEGLNEPLPAKFREIATAADSVTRTFEVKLGFEAPEGAAILPGMSAKVVMELGNEGQEEVLRVPALAVISDTQKTPSVFLVDKKTMTVERHPVKVGQMIDDEIEVLEGLSSGDVIATSGLDALLDGKKVVEYSRTAKK